jgi:hypothetical protein
VPATLQDDTGQIRIPLTLFHLDHHQCDVELVPSKTESEQLSSEPTRLVNGAQPMLAAGPR